jgi:hypothetical protein
MRKFLVAFAVLGMFAMVANANDITFYFGRPQTVVETTDFVPDAALPVAQPAPPGTYTLGIWASIDEDVAAGALDVWHGMHINILADEGVEVSGLTIDNFDHRIGIGTDLRWETGSDFGPGGSPTDFYLVSVIRAGLGGLMPREITGGTAAGTDWWSFGDEPPCQYWLGNVTLSYSGADPKNVYFQIGTGGIARRGGVPAEDLIYFGLDEPVGLFGYEFLAISSLPDFTFTPEPASLILLSLAGLFLRRR